MVLAIGALASCGGDDDSSGDSTLSNGDDNCSGICGCDGCPQTGGPMLPTSTSAGTGTGTGSSAGTSTGAPATDGGPDTSAGESTGSPGTGGFDCVCDPAATDLPICTGSANCSEQGDGAECCDPRGQIYVCTQNDIGVIWIPQHTC